MGSGQVTINDTPTKSKLYRFCEKKIGQWVKTRLENRSPVDGGPDEIQFRVSFTEETNAQQVSCVTEIHLGGSLWRGCDLAGDTQNAFMHSLKRLQPH